MEIRIEPNASTRSSSLPPLKRVTSTSQFPLNSNSQYRPWEANFPRTGTLKVQEDIVARSQQSSAETSTSQLPPLSEAQLNRPAWRMLYDSPFPSVKKSEQSSTGTNKVVLENPVTPEKTEKTMDDELMNNIGEKSYIQNIMCEQEVANEKLTPTWTGSSSLPALERIMSETQLPPQSDAQLRRHIGRMRDFPRLLPKQDQQSSVGTSEVMSPMPPKNTMAQLAKAAVGICHIQNIMHAPKIATEKSVTTPTRSLSVPTLRSITSTSQFPPKSDSEIARHIAMMKDFKPRLLPLNGLAQKPPKYSTGGNY